MSDRPPFHDGYDAGSNDRTKGTFTRAPTFDGPRSTSVLKTAEWLRGYHCGHMSHDPANKEETT